MLLLFVIDLPFLLLDADDTAGRLSVPVVAPCSVPSGDWPGVEVGAEVGL
jgi:hypothetical protein